MGMATDTETLREAFRSIPQIRSLDGASAERRSDLLCAAEEFAKVLRKLAVQQMRDSREILTTIQQSLGKAEQAYEAWQREQQRATASERQAKELATVLVGVLDLLDRMAASFESLDGMKEWARQTGQAVQLCLAEAGKVGLTALGSPGEPFDEKIHDIGQGGSPGHAGPWTVRAVVVRGYALNGQILRRAVVEL